MNRLNYVRAFVKARVPRTHIVEGYMQDGNVVIILRWYVVPGQERHTRGLFYVAPKTFEEKTEEAMDAYLDYVVKKCLETMEKPAEELRQEAAMK